MALIFGGTGGEHEVSCISAASIYLNLDPSKYRVTALAIAKDGRWYHQEPYIRANVEAAGRLTIDQSPDRQISLVPGAGLSCAGQILKIDIAFPIVHGIGGEDGRLQGLLETAGIPYCGSGLLGSALGMDKAVAKRLWELGGLPVVPYRELSLADHRSDPGLARRLFDELVQDYGLPLFLKPVNSGSSVGVSKLSAAQDLVAALETAFAIDTKVLIEKGVDAREVEVAVVGTHPVRAYGPGEIVPRHEFYDYDAKYLDPDGAQLLIPARLDKNDTQRILDLAVKAYQAVEGQGFSRVDFFVDRQTNEIFINEINTLPGFTTISMFPRMCMSGGFSYAQVLDMIIDDALAVSRLRSCCGAL